MPEDMESPVEKLQDDIVDAVEHVKEAWLKWAAMLSALFAVLAAVAGLQSAHFANDAMLEQIAASNQWAYYQAKGIKANIAESSADLLKQLGKPDSHNLAAKLEQYRKEQDEIKQEATQKTDESKRHLQQHETLSYAVTLFQVAIAMVAIALLTRRRRFVLFSCALCLGGLVFLVGAFIN